MKIRKTMGIIGVLFGIILVMAGVGFRWRDWQYDRCWNIARKLSSYL